MRTSHISGVLDTAVTQYIVGGRRLRAVHSNPRVLDGIPAPAESQSGKATVEAGNMIQPRSPLASRPSPIRDFTQ